MKPLNTLTLGDVFTFSENSNQYFEVIFKSPTWYIRDIQTKEITMIRKKLTELIHVDKK